jgi:hypothetical protein
LFIILSRRCEFIRVFSRLSLRESLTAGFCNVDLECYVKWRIFCITLEESHREVRYFVSEPVYIIFTHPNSMYHLDSTSVYLACPTPPGHKYSLHKPFFCELSTYVRQVLILLSI